MQTGPFNFYNLIEILTFAFGIQEENIHLSKILEQQFALHYLIFKKNIV